MYLKEDNIETLSIKAQRDLAFGLAASSTLDEALPLCLDIAITVSGMDSGGIYIQDSNSDFILSCVKGLSESFVSEFSSVKADTDRARLIIQGSPVYTKYENLSGSFISDKLKSEGLLAVGIIPVISHEKIVACLNISSHTIDEIPLPIRNTLETISAHIGNVIARIKSEEELCRYRIHLEELVEERTCELKSINRRLEKEIAERKEAEVALREREDILRKNHFLQKAILDNIPDIAWLKDRESRFIAVNDPFLKAFNVTSEELQGKTDFYICPAELAERYRKDDKKIIMSGKRMHVVEPLSDKEGNMIWIDTIKTPVFDEKGEVIGTTGIARDISDRKIAEDKLLSTNRQLQDIIDFLPDATFAIDREKKVIAWNRIVEEMTGVNKEDIVGKIDAYSKPFYGYKRPMLLDLIENPDLNLDEQYEYIEKKEKIIYGEIFSPSMFNGRGAYLWIIASPLFDIHGNLAGAIESIRDITERKTLEKALRDSERNFRKLSEEYHILLDAIPDTLLVLSNDMEILWVNTAAVFHLDEDTVLKRKCHSLFYNEEKPCENCPVLKTFSTGKAESSQVFTSNNRCLDVRARPIKDEHGHISKIIVLARDMTEKVFLQREALRTSHLASIGELAAGVAHEINNPLTGIINYAQILANKSEKNSKNYDVCTKIIKEGDRIARIVRSLLSFARSTRQDKMPAEINQIFTDSIILTGARMNRDGITLHVNIPEKLPKIMAEPNQLQQVFLNILSNARYALNKKYPSYDTNKIIDISCEEISMENKKIIRIIFYDSGCGIAFNIIDKLFNPFFTTKPPGEGTGLGLSISYGIINEHNGHISIDSVEGEFTKVIIDLPVWEGQLSEGGVVKGE